LTVGQHQFWVKQVESMSAHNIELRIWRQEVQYAEKMLFAPGFADPWPQWRDVDMEHWSETDQQAYKEACWNHDYDVSEDERTLDKFLGQDVGDV
jgi:hypothetical protein